MLVNMEVTVHCLNMLTKNGSSINHRAALAGIGTAWPGSRRRRGLMAVRRVTEGKERSHTIGVVHMPLHSAGNLRIERGPAAA